MFHRTLASIPRPGQRFWSTPDKSGGLTEYSQRDGSPAEALSNQRTGWCCILPPTFRRTARVWWTFCWRAVIYRIIAAVAVSFPLGWTMGFLAAILPGRATSALITLAVQITLDAVVGMFVIYSNILDEDISDFRVALLPREGPTIPLTTAAAPTELGLGASTTSPAEPT